MMLSVWMVTGMVFVTNVGGQGSVQQADIDKKLRGQLEAGEHGEAERTIATLSRAGLARDAAVGRLVIASRSRDAGALLTLASGSAGEPLHSAPNLQAHLALAVAWTAGASEAADLLQKVCTRGEADAVLLEQACALRSVARRSDGGALNVGVARQETTTVPLLQGPKLPVLAAAVGGRKPVYFILDTGAPTSILSQSYCDRVGIGYDVAGVYSVRDSAGTTIQARQMLVEEVRIGDVVVRNWTPSVVRLPDNFQVGGILSPHDTFKDFHVEFNLAAGEIRIHRPDGSAAVSARTVLGDDARVVRIVWDDGNPFVHGTVGGRHAGWFHLDTGAGANFVLPAVARELGEQIRSGDAQRSAAAGGTVEVFEGFRAPFGLDGTTEQTSYFMVKERRPDPNALVPLRASGYLGVPWVTAHRFLLLAGGSQLAFTE